tara:strand:+ start:174 stop:410 length:237 start_codon:yes stop_codon:yes gene_type:complete
MSRLRAWERGMMAAIEFKKWGLRIHEPSREFFGVKRHIPREARRKIAQAVRTAKAGNLLSSKHLNEQYVIGFFQELEK